MNSLIELIGYASIFIGVFFLLVTALGLIRLPDFYTRLHAGSTCLTAGGIAILIGVILFEGFTLHSFKLISVIGFLLIINPIMSHAISRAAYQFGLNPYTTKQVEISEAYYNTEEAESDSKSIIK